MRVVGYVREGPGTADSDTAYAQTERIRRWVADAGHSLIAVCRDTRSSVEPLGRNGYRALLGIARNGDAEAVVVADLGVLSSDKVVQEIMLHDLAGSGVTVVPVTEEDQLALQDAAKDHTRLVTRDVLAKVDEYRDQFQSRDRGTGAESDHEATTDESHRDVIIELIKTAQGDQTEESAAQAARPTA